MAAATAFPWKLYGGAARPDAISGLAPTFAEALTAFYQAAPPEVQRELGLNSAYRSPERQKELWDASDKSGRMVAAPGKSHHNQGDAVDLYGFGLGNKLDLVSQQTRDWVKANAAAHGFYFPMDYEPWHMQMKAPVAGGPQQQGPPMPKNKTDYTPEQRRNAIAAIESAGSGDYAALGPEIARRGGAGPGVKDRAYGRYQVMGSNIPAWTKEVLGREMTPQEFLADPAAQDAVFDKKFGDYVAKHGESGAASMWFTGRPNAPNAKDALGTSGGGYVEKYLNSLGAPKEGAPYPTPQSPGAPPAAPGTPVAGAPAEPPKDPLSENIMGAADSLSAMAGGGKPSANQMPIAKAPAPTATPTFSEPGQLLNAGAVDAQRQQLAMALQRLNSGKLWV